MSLEEQQFDDERDVIEGHFKSAWGSLTAVKYENQPWDTPNAKNYVALTLVRGAAADIGLAQQVELRQKALHRYGGTVIVQVFQKERTGTGEANKLAGKVAAIFRNQELCKGDSGLLRFRTPSVVPIGANNGWWQLNVSCPYFRDNYHERPS